MPSPKITSLQTQAYVTVRSKHGKRGIARYTAAYGPFENRQDGGIKAAIQMEG